MYGSKNIDQTRTEKRKKPSSDQEDMDSIYESLSEAEYKFNILPAYDLNLAEEKKNDLVKIEEKSTNNVDNDFVERLDSNFGDYISRRYTANDVDLIKAFNNGVLQKNVKDKMIMLNIPSTEFEIEQLIEKNKAISKQQTSDIALLRNVK